MIDRQNICDIEIVCDNQQIFMIQQLMRNCFGGCADVHEDRCPIRDGPGTFDSNRLFAHIVQATTFFVNNIHNARRHNRTSMHSFKPPTFCKIREITPDGLHCDIVDIREAVHGDFSLFASKIKDLFLSKI